METRTPGRLRKVLIFWGLGALGLGAPVLETIAASPDFFVARRVGSLDFAAISVFLFILQPLVLLLPFMITWRRWPEVARSFYNLGLFFLILAIVLATLNRYPLFGSRAVYLVALPAAWMLLRLFQDFSVFSSGAMAVGAISPMVPLAFYFLAFPAGSFNVGVSSAAVSDPSIKQQLPPIMMVVFDEFPLVSLLNSQGFVDRDAFPQFARLADRAHWFRNASTVVGFTHLAIPTILTGNNPEFSRRRIPTAIDYPGNLFTSLAGKYELNVYEQVTSLCPATLCRNRAFSESLRQRLLRLSSEVFDLEQRLILPLTDYLIVTNKLQTWEELAANLAGFTETEERRFSDFRGLTFVPEWDDDKHFFNGFLSGLHPTQTPTLSFIHFTLPHAPYTYFPTGREYFADNALVNSTGFIGVMSSDSALAAAVHQRYLIQAQFADRLLGRMLDRLESLGILDQLMIVVTADHGTAFVPGDHTRVPSEKNYDELLLVPLFIKLPHQAKGVISDRNAELPDILPTMLAQANLRPSFAVTGVDLLDPKTPERKEKQFFILNDAGTGLPVVLPPYIDPLPFARQQEKLFGPGLQGLLNFELHPDLIGQPLSEVSSLNHPKFEILLSDPERFNHVSKGKGAKIPGLIHATIKSQGAFGGRLVVALGLNGTVQAIGVTSEFQNGQALLEAMLPDIGFIVGKNNLQVIPLGKLSAQDEERFQMPSREFRPLPQLSVEALPY